MPGIWLTPAGECSPFPQLPSTIPAFLHACPPHSLFLIVMSRASCVFSNRSDEDDLPPDLAEAVGTTPAPPTNNSSTNTQVSVPLASPKIQKVSSPQKAEGMGPLSPGAKVGESPEARPHQLGVHYPCMSRRQHVCVCSTWSIVVLLEEPQ